MAEVAEVVRGVDGIVRVVQDGETLVAESARRIEATLSPGFAV